VRDKVLQFGLSCATNCATHDPQLLTITTFWHTQAGSILLTNSKTRLSAS